MLKNSNIREQGSHRQLLVWDGWYARMMAEREKACR